jgi:hypothetical protein
LQFELQLTQIWGEKMDVGLYVFYLWGGGLFVNILKAHGLRSMGLGVLNAARVKKTHPAQWAGLIDGASFLDIN